MSNATTLEYMVVDLPEIWNVLSHIPFLFVLEILFLMEEYVVLALWVIIIIISVSMHGSAFFMGLVGFESLASWKLTDHISAQGGVVIVFIMTLVVENRNLRNGVMLFTVFCQAMLMRIADVLYFTIAISGTAFVLSLFFQYPRWKRAYRSAVYWLALAVAGLALVMFFMPDSAQDYSHGIWHIAVAVDAYFWMVLIWLFFQPTSDPIPPPYLPIANERRTKKPKIQKAVQKANPKPSTRSSGARPGGRKA